MRNEPQTWPWSWREFHEWKKLNPRPITPVDFLKGWLPSYVKALQECYV